MPAVVEALEQLGPVFRWREARSPGLSDPAMYPLLAEGRLGFILPVEWEQRHGHTLQLPSTVAA